MSVDKGLRRAILRKTRNTRVPQLEPGQRCSFWRWRKRGLRKRGAWSTARFLAWGPECPGKQAWLRSGNTTILVATEQLREAIGWESWKPDEQDVAALKDAVTDLKDSVWSDERGKPPLNDNLDDDDEYRDYEPSLPPTPAIVIPAGSQ